LRRDDLAAAIGARGTHGHVLTGAPASDAADAQFDAARLDGLENERWDRWLLQSVHRTLRADAPIVVSVPPLASLASAVDLRFLAYASRKVLERFVQRRKPGFRISGAVHRRYRFSALARKLESVGYTAIEPGPGWRGSRASPGRAWIARRATVIARKQPSLPGVQGRGWPDAAAHSRRFAEQYAHLYAAREAWHSRFPEYRAPAASALRRSAWGHARVLVLAPHPDDELIGCGGTLCGLLSAGAQAWIVQATDGARLESLRDLPPERRKTIRLEEAQRVASALSAGLIAWREENEQLRCCGETIGRLARLLEELRPTHVFTPFLGDLHAEHGTLSRILAAALALVDVSPRVLQYEAWGLVPANAFCDITEHAEQLERLLLLYEMAMRVDDFVHFCANRNLAHALALTGQPGYVEAFLDTPSAEYRSLAERTS
jgi:LmbE family N-acetylglucosaminyl deacetylase